MAAPTAPPLSRPPTERTFIVAAWLLGIFAVVQAIAAALVLAARIDVDAIGRQIAAKPAAPNAAPAPTVAQDVAQLTQANKLMAEGDEFRAQGNFRAALEAYTEADRLVPNKPGILLQVAADHAALGQSAEAAATLQRIVALPPSGDPADAMFVEQARAALGQLGASATPSRPAVTPDANATGVRDEIGIPIGSVMGIVTAEMSDSGPKEKKLRVAIKAASDQNIDVLKFAGTVTFYQQDDQGDLQPVDRQQTDWLSNPVNWANGDLEMFETRYRVPPADRGDLPPLNYHGYVVAIYYNGELQDSRADPVSLLDKFPPPLSRETASE